MHASKQVARAIEKRIAEAQSAGDLGAIYFEIRGTLDHHHRVAKAAFARPVGRPRTVVPHFTLLDVAIMQQTYGGAIEETASTDAPLTVATLAELASPLTTWASRHAPYHDAAAWLPELARVLDRFQFDLPRNGRSAVMEFTISNSTHLRARIVRSDAPVQAPYGEYTESSPSQQSGVAS